MTIDTVVAAEVDVVKVAALQSLEMVPASFRETRKTRKSSVMIENADAATAVDALPEALSSDGSEGSVAETEPAAAAGGAAVSGAGNEAAAGTGAVAAVAGTSSRDGAGGEKDGVAVVGLWTFGL